MDSRRTLQRRTIRSGVVDLAPGHPINDLRIPGAFALLLDSALLFLLRSFFLSKLLGINLLLQGISLRLKRIELSMQILELCFLVSNSRLLISISANLSLK